MAICGNEFTPAGLLRMLVHRGVNNPRDTPLQPPPPAGGGFKSPPAREGIEGGVTDGLLTRPGTSRLVSSQVRVTNTTLTK